MRAPSLFAYWQQWSVRGTEVRSLSFPPDALVGRSISHVAFVDCRFQPTRLDQGVGQDVVFERCEFERLDVDVESLHGVSFTDCKIHSLIPQGADTGIFDPKTIQGYLRSLGAQGQEELHLPVAVEPALELSLKVIRFFRRSTELGENTIKARLGKRGKEFLDGAVEPLQKAGVLRLVPHQGSGVQRRFRLTVPMRKIETAEAACDGRFEDFLKKIQS